ncbi:hypothetical protein SCHPADRAFT_886121 [Schizopora paradoxa]|uniref:Uncharacterized protein n=1 Tax=Schizopora paradoxa TaxID=27342 RepID=A0A0H2SA79_9AGAM|nr:hypothetical protein SCHPADRAFT_886121 [Schizopora paradoxa]
MFGEADSESPRTGSPWDGFLSSSGTTSPASRDVACTPKDGLCAVPKLVPEVEEGNVEYKLQLLSPSPARFAKLVTQLKWRLLEGGGQALYEVGVADSGQLVGLCRRDLECSLETLEEMAGEIGASVIVVKEIEVPRTRYGIGKWGIKTDGAMRMPKLLPPAIPIEELEDASSSEAETTDEDELFSTMLELPFSFDDDVKPSGGGFAHRQFGYNRADPSRPSAQSSPFVAPVEEDDNIFTLDLEISSVYKPRPMRKRSSTSLLPSSISAVIAPSANDTFDMCLDLGAEMEALSLANKPEPIATSMTQSAPRVFVGKDPNYDMERKIEKKAKKRDRRNANREKRRYHRAMHQTGGRALQGPSNAEAVEELDELLAPVPIAAAMGSNVRSLVPSLDSPFFHTPSPGALAVCEDDSRQDLSQLADEGDKRYIVEALVVRKMSVDEAFLDFEGFSILEM